MRMAICWPKRIAIGAAYARQFRHVTDFVPTIPDAIDILDAYMVNGICAPPDRPR
jgi:arylsulfatase A-like enzyme